MKNFPAGDWYPFSTFQDGRIVDAKTCTVVGAALYQDICNGNLPGMTVQEESENRPSRQYYWSILPSNSGSYDDKNAERQIDGALLLLALALTLALCDATLATAGLGCCLCSLFSGHGTQLSGGSQSPFCQSLAAIP